MAKSIPDLLITLFICTFQGVIVYKMGASTPHLHAKHTCAQMYILHATLYNSEM